MTNTTAKGETMTTKTFLLKVMSELMVTNWIKTGDCEESQRSSKEKAVRRIYKNYSAGELKVMFDNMSMV